MKKSILTSVIFAALIVISTFNAHSQGETKEEIKAKIEKINAKAIEAMLSGDHAASLVNYTDDAISLPNYQPMLKGIAAIKQANEAMVNSGAKITSFTVVIDNLIIGEEIIVEIGEYEMKMDMPMMDNTYTDIGKYMTVWQKQKDGTLKIKADTWNTNSNPWQ